MSTIEPEPPRGIGIYRISKDAGRRAAGKLHSDDNQQDSMQRDADREGILMTDWLDETNVPGDTPLERRPYGEAIARVERGEADVILFASSDRHDRDMVISRQAIERMDATDRGVILVGGQAYTHKTMEGWVTSTMGSFMSEWQKRVIRQKSRDGVEAAVAMGRVPYPQVGLGFILQPDNTLKLAPERVLRVVRRAFEMRADGATIQAVREYLASKGHARGYRAVQRLLASPLYIGEIRYGGKLKDNGTRTPLYVNADPGFDAIVDRALWERVQAMSVPAGRNSKSERLLARLGVVRCGGCGARMNVGSNVVSGTRHTFYRCGRQKENGCPARATIHAERLEAAVLERTAAELADMEERESVIREAREAEGVARQAQEALGAAEARYMALPPGDHPEALAVLEQLRADAKAERATADELSDLLGEVDVLDAPAVLADPDPASIPAKRVLIRRTWDAVRITPGRAPFAERVSFEPRRPAAA